MSKITEQVEALIQPVLNDLNFELVDIEYVKEGKDHFLLVFLPLAMQHQDNTFQVLDHFHP